MIIKKNSKRTTEIGTKRIKNASMKKKSKVKKLSIEMLSARQIMLDLGSIKFHIYVYSLGYSHH